MSTSPGQHAPAMPLADPHPPSPGGRMATPDLAPPDAAALDVATLDVAALDVAALDVATRPGARAWAIVAVLLLLSATAWTDRSVIAMVVAPIKAQFGIDDVRIGLLAGLAFSVFYVVFLVPIGWLADRWSPALILFCGVLVWSLATIGFGLAPGFGALVAARMLVGAGEGVVSPIAAATISRRFGRARMAAPMSLFSLGSSLGTAIGVLVAGHILAADAGNRGFAVPLIGHVAAWQFVYLVLGVPGVALALLAFTIGGRPAPAAAPRAALPAGGTWAFIRTNPRAFCGTVLGFVLVNTAVTSVLAWMPEHLRRSFALGPASIGTYMMVVSLGAPLVCQLGVGLVVNRLIARGVVDAPLRVLRWLVIAALPFGAALWWAPTAPIAGIAMFGLLALIFASNPLGSTAIQLIAPDHLRSGLAAFHLAMLGIVGIALGSSLVALIEQYVLHAQDLGPSLGLAVCGCLIAAAAMLRFAEPAVRRLLAAAPRPTD